MPLESLDDVRSFFEIDNGPAIRALIVGPVPSLPTPPNQQFAKTLAVIFRASSQPVDTYGDTDIEAGAPTMLCVSEDLDGVKSKFTVRFLGLLPGEDGYGKTYEVTSRIAKAGFAKSRVYLKEL